MTIAIANKEQIYQLDRQGLNPLDRAAAKQDSIQTNYLIKQLFGTEASFNFSKTAVDPLLEQYNRLDEAIFEKKTVSLPFLPPLHRAAFLGNLSQIIDIASPEKLQMKDSKGLTPLHYAILGKKHETVRYLLDKCDLKELTFYGESYLHYAALSGDSEMLNLFIGKVDAALFSPKLKTAAHVWAANSSDLKSLTKILDTGTPHDSNSPRLLSPIDVIVLKGFEKYRDPLDKADIKLCVVNIVRLFLMTQMHRISYSGDLSKEALSNFHIYSLSRDVLGLYKRAVIQSTVPPDKKGIISFAASPLVSFLAHGGDNLLNSAADQRYVAFPRFLSAISSCMASGIALANGVKGIVRCKTTTLPKAMTAVPIHLFNMGCAYLDVLVNLMPGIATNARFLHQAGKPEEERRREEFNGDDFFRDLGGEDQCKEVSASAYKNTPAIDRLLDPSLTKNLGTTTTDLFGRAFVDPVCKENYGILLDPNNPPTDCASAKKPYRKLGIEMHPDKQLPDSALKNLNERCADSDSKDQCVKDLQNKAFVNLAAALEAFCPKKSDFVEPEKD